MRPVRDLMASLISLTDGSVRQIRKTAEDPPRISVLGVIGAVTGHSPTVCSHTLQDMLRHFHDIGCLSSNFKFPGRGQRETPVTCIKGAVTIVMLIPGRAAASVRKIAASTLVRYLGGDLTLVDRRQPLAPAGDG